MTLTKLAAAARAAAALAWAQAPDCKMVPGWQQQGEPRTHNAENLFEYMDGAAEGYLIYGFKEMKGVNCQRGEDVLTIDVFEMNDPDAAYGIFSSTQDPAQPVQPIGMAGQIGPRRAGFVKGSHYVEIGANPEKDHSASLKAFITALEQRTSGRTTPPAALAWFPTEKRTSLRLIPESVLGLRLLKQGYAAQYDFGKAFVVKETSEQAASGVMEKLRARYADAKKAAVAQDAFQATDKYLGRLCFFRKGAYLAGYSNVAEGQDPVALATTLAAKIP